LSRRRIMSHKLTRLWTQAVINSSYKPEQTSHLASLSFYVYLYYLLI